MSHYRLYQGRLLEFTCAQVKFFTSCLRYERLAVYNDTDCYITREHVTLRRLLNRDRIRDTFT